MKMFVEPEDVFLHCDFVDFRKAINGLVVFKYLYGARASAILYSLVETAKANDLVVHNYISTCLQHVADRPDDLEPLLPWNMKHS